MRVRAPGLVIALWTMMAEPATACLCEIISPAGGARVRSWSERPRIFIGVVLEVDPTPAGPSRQVVRFVTEASWRGAMRDTVTLVVGRNSPCADYVAGRRYLVLADTTADPQAGLVTSSCDYAWGIGYSAAVRMQVDLGAPGWRAPPMGSRSLDAYAKPIGTPISRRFVEGHVAFVVPSGADIERFQIGDWIGPGGGPVLFPAPGIYQYRITWTDGTVYESYVSMRCDPRLGEGRCQALPSFGGIR